MKGEQEQHHLSFNDRGLHYFKENILCTSGLNKLLILVHFWSLEIFQTFDDDKLRLCFLITVSMPLTLYGTVQKTSLFKLINENHIIVTQVENITQFILLMTGEYKSDS